MEPEQTIEGVVNETQSSVWNTVTPLSKYLAMVLFVGLPFFGGWVGYTFAPEREVFVYKEVTDETKSVSEGATERMHKSTRIDFETDSISVEIQRMFNATRTIPFDLNQYPTSSLSMEIELENEHNGVPTNVTFDLPSNWLYLNESSDFSPSRYSFSMLKPDVFISSDYAEEWPTEPCMGGCDGTPWVTRGVRLEYYFRELSNASIETIKNRWDCPEEKENCQITDWEDGYAIISSQSTTAKTIEDGGRTYVNLIIYREVGGLLGLYQFHISPSDEYGIPQTLKLANFIKATLNISG